MRSPEVPGLRTFSLPVGRRQKPHKVPGGQDLWLKYDGNAGLGGDRCCVVATEDGGLGGCRGDGAEDGIGHLPVADIAVIFDEIASGVESIEVVHLARL